MSQLFASGGQSIGASVSASVLPINIQGWFLLGLAGLISLQSKGLSGAVLGIFNCILFFKQTRTKLLVTQSIDIFAATDLWFKMVPSPFLSLKEKREIESVSPASLSFVVNVDFSLKCMKLMIVFKARVICCSKYFS